MVNLDAKSKQENITVNIIGQDSAVMPSSFSSNNMANKNDTLPIELKNSIGRVTCEFEPYQIAVSHRGRLVANGELTNKNLCNAFLIKKKEKLYLISVRHVSKIYKDKTKITIGDGKNKIEMPCKEEDFPKKILFQNPLITEEVIINGNNLFTEDSFTQKEKEKVFGKGVTLDVMCLDVTEIGSKDNLISYDSLASLEDKEEIDNNIGEVFLCGFPAIAINEKSFNPQSYENRQCNLKKPIRFGGLVHLANGEVPPGFFFDAKLDEGDCGRPVILKLKSGYKIIGIFKTSDVFQGDSLCIDSMAIRFIIDNVYGNKN